MTNSNAILSEYYGQTKGSNILLASDDFWVGAWLGSMLGRDGGDTDGNCCSCFGCIIAIIGVIACFTGKLGIWLCGLKDMFCGTCSFCTSCCSIGPGWDAGSAGCDQACDGLSAICCI